MLRSTVLDDPLVEACFKIRNYQWVVASKLSAGDVKNPVHLALGHEVVAALLANNFDVETDCVCLPHRNIHFHLALALKFRPDLVFSILAEIIGKTTGSCNGHLGSMNIFEHSIGSHYTSSILANSLGFACGRALMSKDVGGGVVTVVLGDGAIEEGRFWEALIFSVSQKIPLVFVIENNGWSMQSSISQRRGEICLEQTAAAAGLMYRSIDIEKICDDGRNDVWAEINARRLPSILEIKLNTFGGATVDEPDGMRTINYHAGAVLNLTVSDFEDQFSLGDGDWLTSELATHKRIKPALKSEFVDLMRGL